MKHCDRCDVDIADNIKNCPLCGRDISAESDDELESFVCYPDNKIWFSKRNTVLNTSFLIILIGVIVSIVTELIIFHRFSYNWYVLTGAMMFALNILMPLKFRWSFSNVSIVSGLSICAYILFLELFTGTFGWGVYYVIPFFVLFMTLYCTIIMAIRNYYKGMEFVICLMIFAILAVALFVYNSIAKVVVWPSLVAFLASITCFVCFLIFKFKKVKQALTKSFFI